MAKKLKIKESAIMTESVQLPTIGKIGVDVLNTEEYIIRDKLGLMQIYETPTQRIFAAWGNRKKELIVATIDDGGNTTLIWIFYNVNAEDVNNIVDNLSQFGVDSTAFDDYDCRSFSFWEYLQEQQ